MKSVECDIKNIRMVPRKRNRPSLSCNYCKKRKVKCDREKPCSSCIKFKVAEFCSYDEKSTKDDATLKSGSPKKPRKMNASVINSRLESNPHTLENNEAISAEQKIELLSNKLKIIEAALGTEIDNRYKSTESNSLAFYKRPSFTFNDGGSPSYKVDLSTKIPRSEFQLWENVRQKVDYYKNINYCGLNPCASSTETINFYDGYVPIHISPSRRIYCGPYAWICYVRKDPYLAKIWECIMEAFKKIAEDRGRKYLNAEKKLPKTDSGTVDYVRKHYKLYDLNGGPSDNEFTERAIERLGLNDVKQFTFKKKDSEDLCETTSSPNAKLLSYIYGDTMCLMNLIKSKLPQKKAIWIFIKLFFKYIYPFVPFTDEFLFREELSRIIGPEDYSEENVENLNLEKKLDFAFIAVLFIILRLTYLSFIPLGNENIDVSYEEEDPSDNEDINYIMKEPIEVNVIGLAQICLDQFPVFKRNNIEVLKAHIFMIMYRVYAPEEGVAGDPGDFNIYVGTLTQMAYCLGLHLDPSNFPGLKDERENNLGRKIWCYLKAYDVIQGYSVGNIPLIDVRYSDVMFPKFSAEASNIKDIQIEEALLKNVGVFKSMYDSVEQILNVTLPVLSVTEAGVVTSMLSKLENNIRKEFGTFSDYFIPYDNMKYRHRFTKIAYCRVYISLRTFILSVQFHFFLHYEKLSSQDLKFFYMKRIIKSISGDMIEAFAQLTCNNAIHFGKTANLFLTPDSIMMTHRCIQFCMAFLIRIKSLHQITLSELKSQSSEAWNAANGRATKLEQLYEVLRHIVESYSYRLKKLSHKYFYAWKVSKGNRALIGLMFGDSVYKNIQADKFFITDSQVQELIDICKEGLHKLKNSNVDKLNKPYKAGSVMSEIMTSLDSTLQGKNSGTEYQTPCEVLNENLSSDKEDSSDKDDSYDKDDSSDKDDSLSKGSANIISDLELDEFWKEVQETRSLNTEMPDNFDWQDLYNIEIFPKNATEQIGKSYITDYNLNAILNPDNYMYESFQQSPT